MGLIGWLFDRVGRDKATRVNASGADDGALGDYVTAASLRDLSFRIAVNLIANSVSKCEFRTYKGKKEIKEQEYYTFNLSPNKNQNSSEFLRKLVYRLYYNNECLVIDVDGQLFIADAFTRKPYTLYDDLFEQVQVGEVLFQRTFTASEVLYFRLHDSGVQQVIDGILSAYAKLMEASMKSYHRSRGMRAVLKFGTVGNGGADFSEQVNKYVQDNLKKYMTSADAVLPEFNGMEYKQLSDGSSAVTTRDIRAMLNDVLDLTANLIGIPPALLRGDVTGTKDAMDQYLTFCVDPLCDMLQEEINRKRNGYAGFTSGNYLVIDTKSIKHVDLLSVSTSIDKLIGSGAFCINDILRIVGDQEIDEPWANQHWMTKNYSPASELLNELGGNENAKTDSV